MKQKIIAVLRRNDHVGMHAVGRALVRLYDRQTSDEKATESTQHKNYRGFTKGDGPRGVGMAKFYKSAGFLTEKQLAYWQSDCGGKLKRPRIEKYWRQLAQEAARKNGDNT